MLKYLTNIFRAKILDIAGDEVNPATDAKLDELKALLTAIDENTDELEIKADTVILNTDELEAKIQSVRDQLDVLTSTRASENTLNAILNALGEESANNLLLQLKEINTSVDGVATETTLIAVRDYLDTVETKLQSLINKNQAQETGGNLDDIKTNTDKLDVNLSTVATENTVTEIKETIGQESGSTVLTRLQDIWDKLSSLFTDGLAKFKIWDGTTIVEVTDNHRLKVETCPAEGFSSFIHGDNAVDLNNSTVETLGIGEYFEGEWTEILYYSMVIIQVYSSHTSALNGLEIQWSTDGIDVDDMDTYTIINTSGKIFSFGAQSKYYRVKYTNGTQVQTTFKLQAILKTLNQKPSSHRILDSITDQNDAELVKAVLTAKDPTTGDFVNVNATSDGNLNVYLPPTTRLNTTVQLVWDKLHNAPNNYEWQELLEYEVPEGYDLSAVSFSAKSGVANENARVVSKICHGSFDCVTDTYTDSGLAWSLPKFGTKAYVCVTSAIGSGTNDVITVTYVNSQFIAGRIGTVTIPKNSVVGTRLQVILQTGDDGILDITNVTHSATGQAGTILFSTLLELFYLTLTSSNTQYKASAVSLGGIVIEEKEKVYLQYQANSAVINERRLSLVGTLVEKL